MTNQDTAAKPAATWRAKIDSYLSDLVYGANDGIITVFAVVSGVTGAGLAPHTIIILGFANLIADGFSMGASNFLALRSKNDREKQVPAGKAFRHGGATFVSFVVFGFLPLIAYLVPAAEGVRFQLAMLLTGLGLFGVGALRSWFTGKGALWSGMEMLLVGALAAAVAYGIGHLAARYVPPVAV